ncbi:mCG1045633, partial [Mus musculus]
RHRLPRGDNSQPHDPFFLVLLSCLVCLNLMLKKKKQTNQEPIISEAALKCTISCLNEKYCTQSKYFIVLRNVSW